jgi:hypothetical protein
MLIFAAGESGERFKREYQGLKFYHVKFLPEIVALMDSEKVNHKTQGRTRHASTSTWVQGVREGVMAYLDGKNTENTAA